MSIPSNEDILALLAQLDDAVSGDQAAVWIHQGALPGFEEEHAAAQDAVCTVQSVDGAPPIAGGSGMSAPEDRQMAAKAVQMARKGVESGAKTQAKRHPAHYLKTALL